MGVTRTEATTDEPRRVGLKLRPSLNRELTALATLDGRHTSELLNQAVAEFIDRRRPARPDRPRHRDAISA